MALGHNSSIVRNGLVFYYDMSNTRKSFRGQPSTNLILYSEEFDNSSNWTYSNCGVTRVNSIIAPDGSRNVYGFYGNNVNTYHTIYQFYSYVSGRTYTQSIYVKAGLFTSCFMQFNPSAFGNWIGATFDLVNGTTSAPGAITNVGNGWYRCSVTATATASSSQPAVYFYSSNNTYVGTNTGTQPEVYIFGGQLEESSSMTPYIKTTSTTASRSSTQALLDLTGTNTIPAGSLTYNSNNTFSFNGSSNRIHQTSIPAAYSSVNNSLGRSWEVVVQPTASMTYACIFGHKVAAGCSYLCNGGIYLWDSAWVFNWYDNSNYQFLNSGIAATVNQYVHIVGTYNPSDQFVRIYTNGVLRATSSSTNMNYGGSIAESNIGWNSKNEFGGGGATDYFTGNIPLARYYSNKTLSADEVFQNFSAIRSLYGL